MIPGEGFAGKVFSESQIMQKIRFQVVFRLPGVVLITVSLPLDQEVITPLIQLDIHDRFYLVKGSLVVVAVGAGSRVLLHVLPDRQVGSLFPPFGAAATTSTTAGSRVAGPIVWYLCHLLPAPD